jgi:hypothetical protein
MMTQGSASPDIQKSTTGNPEEPEIRRTQNATVSAPSRMVGTGDYCEYTLRRPIGCS